MKKLKLAMLIICSSVIFAEDLEDKMEINLMKMYPTITDGKLTFPVEEYDVDIEKDILEVEIEISKRDSANFNKVNSRALEKNLSKIANTLRKNLGMNQDVKIKIDLDDSFISDKTYKFYSTN
ncbi:MAG: hypothetical protein ACRC0Y_06555 [Fusobacteriaceae bacterium]